MERTKRTEQKSGGKRNKLGFGATIFIICLLAYPLIHWVVFWLYPNLKTFQLPFMEWDYFESKYVFPHSQGLFYNFTKTIEGFFSINPTDGSHYITWNFFWNTFHSLWINLIILPLAITIGYALAKHVPGEKFFRVIFFLPNIISTVVMCAIFHYMLDGRDSQLNGPIAKIIKLLIDPNYIGWNLEDPKTVWALIYIYCIWTGLSINVVLISSAFQRIPTEIVESAKLDGFSFFGEFIRIGVPLIMPTVTTFLINAVIAVTGFYMQPYMLLNDAMTRDFGTIPWMIFNWTAGGLTEDQTITITTIGILFSLVMFPLIMFARYLGKKLTPKVEF